jgi:hypothetical protein
VRRLLTDPLVFNYVIMSLYAVNAVNFFCRGRYGDMLYWVAAFTITAAVTWMGKLNSLPNLLNYMR